MTSSFTQINDSLIQAGRTFGGSPAYVFGKITLPMISKGIATGWMMIFIISFRAPVTASLIAPPNVLVVSTYINREFEQGSVSLGMAMAVLCVLITTTALLIMNALTGKKKMKKRRRTTMVLVNTDYISGKEFDMPGLVKGSIVQSKNPGKDIGQNLKGLVGGELKAYTEMMEEARELATKRMVTEAEQLGADAIVNGKTLSRKRFMVSSAELAE